MGAKTFRFEDGSDKHEVQFNYSQDTAAQTLLDCFERITETERHFIELDRTVHYDKLGVNDVLLQLQITYEHKRLVAPEQFLPLLDRIANNESILHIARKSTDLPDPAPPMTESDVAAGNVNEIPRRASMPPRDTRRSASASFASWPGVRTGVIGRTTSGTARLLATVRLHGR